MRRIACIALLLSAGIALESGCATKKYVRNQVAERVEPLENRTGELEETSRRNTQQIATIKTGIDDARVRADKAQATADRASTSAEQANTRVAGIEQNVEDLRANLDKYTMQGTSVVFFRAGSALLTKEAMAQLGLFAAQITDRRGYVLEIVGYGDSEKATTHDLNLAQLRAEAVQRYLADKENIPLMRMFAAGFGAMRPSIQSASTGAVSTTGSAQPMPRRVEIRLFTNSAVERVPATTGGSATIVRTPRNP